MYHVTNEIFKQAGYTKHFEDNETWSLIGLPCISCLEQKLERTLEASDFSNAPINAWVLRERGWTRGHSGLKS